MDQQKQAGALRFEHVDFRFSPNYGLALKISILRLLLAQPWASLVQLAVEIDINATDPAIL